MVNSINNRLARMRFMRRRKNRPSLLLELPTEVVLHIFHQILASRPYDFFSLIHTCSRLYAIYISYQHSLFLQLASDLGLARDYAAARFYTIFTSLQPAEPTPAVLGEFKDSLEKASTQPRHCRDADPTEITNQVIYNFRRLQRLARLLDSALKDSSWKNCPGYNRPVEVLVIHFLEGHYGFFHPDAALALHTCLHRVFWGGYGAVYGYRSHLGCVKTETLAIICATVLDMEGKADCAWELCSRAERYAVAEVIYASADMETMIAVLERRAWEYVLMAVDHVRRSEARRAFLGNEVEADGYRKPIFLDQKGSSCYLEIGTDWSKRTLLRRCMNKMFRARIA